jgi:pyruvate formate lyase activating enzyme
LDTAKRFKNSGIHVEITNLIIPGLNDSNEQIELLSKWVVDNLGDDTPTHFSAYHPDFKEPSMKTTSIETLNRAYNIAKKEGINYVYVGNIRHEKGGNTYCPNCNHLILGRSGYRFTKIDITDKKMCPNCQYDLNSDIKGEINRKSSYRY